MMWNNACPLWNGGAFGAWGWIGMILNLIFWVALLAGLIYFVVWMVRRTGSQAMGQTGSAGQMNAREIAQLRYARGEIDREAYLRILEDLR